jgi:hypothetical protein
MTEYEAKYYELLLQSKALNKVLDKHKKLLNQQNIQLAKEAQDELTKLEYQLDIVELSFESAKEEYDKLEVDNNED